MNKKINFFEMKTFDLNKVIGGTVYSTAIEGHETDTWDDRDEDLTFSPGDVICTG